MHNYTKYTKKLERLEISIAITIISSSEVLVADKKYWYNNYANIVDARGRKVEKK